MFLNEIKPAKGAKKAKKRCGRGIASGLGKTCGKGHKGLKSRSGGKVAAGFEGGQMPLQMRLPKFGFNSRKKLVSAEVRLSELYKCKEAIIDIEALKDAKIIAYPIKFAKIICSGEISSPIKIKGIKVTKGAKQAIEAAGGEIIEG